LDSSKKDKTMLKNFRIPFFFLFIILNVLLSASEAPCPVFAFLEGSVYDLATYQGIGGASINMCGQDVVTLPDGAYIAIFPGEGSCHITVQASGYLTYETTVQIQPGSMNHLDFALIPINSPPIIQTGEAGVVEESSAIISSDINPAGSATTAYIEYGLDTNYGSTSAVEGAGDGTFNLSLTFPITGLTPGALYHYRVVGENQYGTSYGEDQIFNTLEFYSSSKAIIVFTADFTGNLLWPSTKELGNQAYNTLLDLGFSKANIKYLASENFDADENSLLDDVDGNPTKANLEDAITNWASGDDETVVIYMVGHGGNGTFRLNESETLSVTELDSWIDTLEQNLPNSTEIIVIYDAPMSGSFIPYLSQSTTPGKARINVTSSSSDEDAYFISEDSGIYSFSTFFWNEIQNLESVNSAYISAKNAMSISPEWNQNSLLDDNGDGLPNTPDDGRLAETYYIGVGSRSVVAITYAKKAIIFAGGGPSTPSFTNDIWTGTNKLAKFAYEALIYQGFSYDEIYLLSTDRELDLSQYGVPSSIIGAEPTEDSFETAITDWAKDAETLLIYMVDHGLPDRFVMNNTPELLAASTINGWLNTFQEQPDRKVLFIYDACYSGSFIDDLASTEYQRMLITSTREDQLAGFSGDGDFSFSNWFWFNFMLRGSSVYESFTSASDFLFMMNPNNFRSQNPQFDFNGDGDPNTNEDIVLAIDFHISDEFKTGAFAPVINVISDPQTIDGTTTSSSTIYVENIISGFTIDKVWALITPPPDPEAEPFAPISASPSLELTMTAQNHFEVTYDSFSLAGTYQIAVFAKDSEGNISVPRYTNVTVEKNDWYEDDDDSGNATTLVLGAPSQFHNFYDTDTQDWYKFYLFSGMQYTIKVSEVGSDLNAVIELYDTNGTSMINSKSDWLNGGSETMTFFPQHDGIFYIKIKPDSPDSSDSNTDYQIRIFRSSGPVSAWFKGTIVNTYTQAPIPDFVITTNGFDSTLNSGDNGQYYINIQFGDWTASIEADGYQPITAGLQVENSQSQTQHFQLYPMFNISDAIAVLQLLSGNTVQPDALTNIVDVNGDTKIGLAEAILILQTISEYAFTN